MVRILSEAGNNVTVLCLTRGDYWESRIKDLGVHVTWVGQHEARPLRLLSILREVGRLNPDILQSSHFFTNFPTAIAGRIFGIPAIGAVRTDCNNEVAGPGRILGLLNLKVPRVVAGNSRAALQNARTFGVPQQRLFFLPNVVDCIEFEFTDKALHSPVRVVTAGRLVEQKRHDRFVRLIWRLSSLQLAVKGMIFGTGPRRGALQEQMRELHLTEKHLQFGGLMGNMRHIYSGADIFVLTSDFEGTPNVVLEAMASGVPVVSTDVGDVRALIEDGVSGFVVSRDNEEDLIARVRQLVEDPSQRRAYAKNARRHVEMNCSLIRLSDCLEALYRSAEDSIVDTRHSA
jgi:glycosyltransferase involved in cell wall biosynthesis